MITRFNQPYTEHELVFVNDSRLSARQVGDLIGRTATAIRMKRSSLKRTPEEKAARVRNNSADNQARQDATREHDYKRWERWTDTDELYVISTMNRPVKEVAITLGRSYYSVITKRAQLSN